MKKILICTISIGNGHRSVAKTLSDYLQSQDSLYQVEVVDVYEYLSPVIARMINRLYESSIKYLPSAYERFYEKTDEDPLLNDKINLTSAPKFRKMLEAVNPDLIIHTYPSMFYIKHHKNDKRIPAISIVTDYYAHKYWLQKNIDYYITPTKQVKLQMEQLGISSECVYDYGIPIKETFYRKVTKDEKNVLLEKYSLPKDKKIIMLMSGGLGMGKIVEVFQKLKDSKYHLIVLAGKNKALKETLDAINDGHTILSFIDYVDDLVNLSDGIITKPGGLTTTEVIASNKPIFVINPIPGQEEWNSRYILNEGLGRRIYSLEMLKFDIESLLSNPLRIEYIEKLSQQLSHPNCLENIYYVIKKILDHD
jgi:processive 1,2-diacylglycerol beta-glucosyltransferase